MVVVCICLRDPPPPLYAEDLLSCEKRSEISFKSLDRVWRKEPIQQLEVAPLLRRPRLDETFAVLLVRATNAAAEKVLGEGVMRKAVGELRKAKWPDYQAACGAAKGDYADPLVFDFTTWIQYAAIGELLQDSTSVDQEVGERFLSLLGNDRNVPTALVRTGYCAQSSLRRANEDSFEFVLEKPANFFALSRDKKCDLEIKLLRALYSSESRVVVDLSTRVDPRSSTVVHSFRLRRQ